MTGIDKRKRTALDRLADAFVDDIFELSDAEVLVEFAENHGDPELNAADMRALFERTVLAMNKSRLKLAQAGVAANRVSPNVFRTDIRNARKKLQRILASNASAKLTLAARKEDELSDSDVVSMLEDLQELGILLPEDEEDGNK